MWWWRWGAYSSAEKHSVYSTAPADWATGHSLGGGPTPLQRSSRCILQPRRTGQTGLASQIFFSISNKGESCFVVAKKFIDVSNFNFR